MLLLVPLEVSFLPWVLQVLASALASAAVASFVVAAVATVLLVRKVAVLTWF